MKIFVAKNPAEAHIVCGLLQTENIQCEVRGEGLFGLKGEIPFSDDTDPYVWLANPEHKLVAEAIVSDYRTQSLASNTTSWICESCNEENEPQFGACWQCGASSPL
ncbi:DUF2007 domain-containing protein [Vibrio sp. T187]|uniref:putative signal transducing protein n=1 Tax=Vibrio TaxID=662 RepID=UPI0010C9EAF1|nr:MULTISPECIES: DUF2007 domain-containing protein [Vibrio]MBW3696610.1 DUF2007 domain-containing protein [Vibrio sp. T187]